MQKLIIILLLFVSTFAFGQKSPIKLTGTYTDGFTSLKINADSTFELKTYDPVFTYTHTAFQSRGKWTDSANVVTLNPGKLKRQPVVSLSEKVLAGADSIQIKINYLTECYENDVAVSKEPMDFEVITLSVNNPKHYINIVRSPIKRVCTFSPNVKNQTVIGESKTITIPKQKIEKLGVYTYGFEKIIDVWPANPEANFFEITVTQPLDHDRMPRGKKVIIKKGYAWYYEHNGKIPTSGFFLSGLKKTTDLLPH